MRKPFDFSIWREGFRGTVVKFPRSGKRLTAAVGTVDSSVATYSSRPVVYVLLAVVLTLLSQGCVKRLAVNSIANAFTEGSAGVYARDDDPILVGEALPFALKTMETLLEQAPKNKKLLISAAAGFVQYAHGFVLQPSSTLEVSEISVARAERERAKRLFLRAHNYGLRALELDYPGVTRELVSNPLSAVESTKADDIPALYWTGVALGSAISIAKNDMSLIGQVPAVRALLERALTLDPEWRDGAIHEFFIVFDAGRTPAEGGGLAKAEEHFERAMQLNRGSSVGPLVALAETVCVRQQDRTRFKSLLNRALIFDADTHPEKRLANLLAQRKAERLLENIDQLFFLDEESSSSKHPFKTVN